jgi:hypothetical protein
MASLHELRELPVRRDYFISFDGLLKVIRDTSIKHNLASKHHIKTRNALDTNAVTRPAEKREIQEGQDTGA